MKSKEKLMKAIEAQLAVAKETKSDFISLTTGEGRALLKELESKVGEWVRVEDELPTEEGQDCWVWSDEWEDGADPEWDNWEGNRGEQRQWANGPEEDREFVASGWYTCTGMNITHWMPVIVPAKPQPPKK